MANRFARFSLTGGLTREEIYRIYDEALDILEKIGIECHHEKILARLSGIKGVMVEKGRVRYKKDFIDSMVKKFQKKAKARKLENEKKPWPASFYLGAAYIGFYIIDYNSDKPRKATLADLINALKLLDSMGIGGNCAPLNPHDVPIQLQRTAMFKTSMEYSKGLGGQAKGAVSLDEAQILVEMGEVSGRKPPYVHLQYFISPLKYDDALLDIGYHFLEKGKNREVAAWGGPMPCAGATSPLFMPAVLIQGIAESLAAEALTFLVFGWDFEPGLYAGVFDMQFGTYIFNSPEDMLLRLAAKQVTQELFYAGPGGGLATNSSCVDAQTAAERAMGAMIGALDGATGFGGAGLISQDMVFSPEQVIIDREILDWLHRFMEGLEVYGEKGLTLKALEEVGPGGNFLAHESTVENLRKFYWNPKLFDRMAVGQWLQQGSLMRERAGKIAQEKINSYKYEIDGSIKNKLDAIYKKAEKILVK